MLATEYNNVQKDNGFLGILLVIPKSRRAVANFIIFFFLTVYIT